MARGNHLGSIVFSDEDRRIFENTFLEVIQKTGWETFCWVLMSNHYHLVFRTPQPNLVEGMTWFQKTFTQRINARNRLRGHLFAGRYKAILVENEELTGTNYRSDYLTNLINYVHLNPGRAGLVDGDEKPVLDYQWSSLARWFASVPSRRPEQAQVSEALDLLQFRDTAAGRRAYIAELDERIRTENAEESGLFQPEGQNFHSTLERGWFWGSVAFREGLIERFSELIKARSDGKNEKGSQLQKDHSLHSAQSIIEMACQHFRMKEADLKKSRYGDLIRPAVASCIAEYTVLPQKQIAELLGMKSAANVSQQIRRFRMHPPKNRPEKVNEFLKKSKIFT